METIKNEITKIVEYYNSQFLENQRKNDEELTSIIETICNKIIEQEYDFSSFESMKITQSNKKREVYKYSEWSVEHFLCVYLKRCLDKKFRVKYANRNEQMHLLFSTLSSLRNMKDYVIVKFDFENFFESISSEYVYKKYIEGVQLKRFQQDIFKRFVNDCKYCYAGINTSNVFAEIIAQDFDRLILQKFKEKGLIFYKRYVDDGILIFNRYIKKDEIYDVIQSSIEEIFKDKNIVSVESCVTKINENKFKYISMRTLTDSGENFNFLGYDFCLLTIDKKKTQIKYGITSEKIEKYTKKINKILSVYKEDGNMELLRHRIRAFACRTVYRRKRYSQLIWKSKGFSSNYCELGLYTEYLDEKTEKFLKEGISKSFLQAGLPLPYFINGKPYSLYHCLKNNTTLLFEENERVGITFETLKKMCRQIGIHDTERKTYNSLVREYLIAVKVGH